MPPRPSTRRPNRIVSGQVVEHIGVSGKCHRPFQDSERPFDARPEGTASIANSSGGNEAGELHRL